MPEPSAFSMRSEIRKEENIVPDTDAEEVIETVENITDEDDETIE